MDIKFSYALDTENLLIKEINTQIQLGNFQEKGILLLEHFTEDLNYPYAILPITQNVEILSKDKVDTFIEDFTQIKDKLMAALTVLFPSNPFTLIEISPTQYGVKNWFVFSENSVHIWHRVDFPVKDTVVAIVEAYIYKLMYSNPDPKIIYSGENYKRKSYILSFLMKSTILSYLYPNYLSLSEQTTEPELDSSIFNESIENYQKLGFPASKVLLEKDSNILLNNEPILLSHNQNTILQLLLSNENRIVTIQQIADILWKGEPDKFSLNAISKLIFDIRNSLKKYGLYKEIIFTKRKAGYILMQ